MKEIVVDGVTYVPKETEESCDENFVLVRTYSAGVHVGYHDTDDQEYKTITLKNARRIWRWKGANTLNELSQNGADMEYTRISEPVPSIALNWIEIIPCSIKAKKNLEQSRWPG